MIAIVILISHNKSNLYNAKYYITAESVAYSINIKSVLDVNLITVSIARASSAVTNEHQTLIIISCTMISALLKATTVIPASENCSMQYRS